MKYIIEGPVFFCNDSTNNGSVSSAIFLDDAVNRGEVTSYATFLNNATNFSNVSAAIFSDDSVNAGVALESTFRGQSKNQGTVVNGWFQGDSRNESQVLGLYKYTDNAINTGWVNDSIYESRPDGAYIDAYIVNGSPYPPANRLTVAYRVGDFYYYYDANGYGSRAFGVYTDGDQYVFKNGTRVATEERVNQDADILGRYVDGVLNIGSGNRLYFYGNYFTSNTDYITGKAAILNNFCVPGVEGGYTNSFVSNTQNYICYNTSILDSNTYESTILAVENSTIYNYSLSLIAYFATSWAYNGKLSVPGFNSWIWGNYVFESREAYQEFVLRTEFNNENYINKVSFIYDAFDRIIKVEEGPSQFTKYVFNGNVFNLSSEAINYVIANSFSMTYALITDYKTNHPSFYGGPFYFDLEIHPLSTQLKLVQQSTYMLDVYVLPDGNIVDLGGYDLYWTSLSTATADNWGSSNVGEFLIQRDGDTFAYSSDGASTGRYYLRSGVLTVSEYNNAIYDGAVRWSDATYIYGNIYGDIYYNIPQGIFTYDAAGGYVFYDKNSSLSAEYYVCVQPDATNNCCDSVLYTNVTDYNNSPCGSLLIVADAWGASNNGRFKYTIINGEIQYYDGSDQQKIPVKTNYWYCNGTRYTNFTSFTATSCYDEMILTLARSLTAFSSLANKQFTYSVNNNYDMLEYFYGAPLTANLWYCAGAEYNTAAAFAANTAMCVDILASRYADAVARLNMYNDYSGRLSAGVFYNDYYGIYVDRPDLPTPYGELLYTFETNFWVGCNNKYTSLAQFCNQCGNFAVHLHPECIAYQ